jgi:hypothetical protein
MRLSERLVPGKHFAAATGSSWPRVCKNTKPHSQFSILAILDESICRESNDNRLYRRISLDRNRRHLF